MPSEDYFDFDPEDEDYFDRDPYLVDLGNRRTSPRHPRKDLDVWWSKDGRKTPIKEMTDPHLAHTIRLLRRREPQHAQMAILMAEATKRKLDINAVAEVDIQVIDAWCIKTGGTREDFYRLPDVQKERIRALAKPVVQAAPSNPPTLRDLLEID